MNILIDTNILLRARDADSPDHAACVAALRSLQNRGESLCLCAQVLIEYWVVATRPREVNGLGISPAEVEEDLRDFEQTFVWLPEPPDIAARWRTLVNQHNVRGRGAHDARLIALMLAHDTYELLTLNSADFARYSEIVCLHPRDVTAQTSASEG